MYVHEEEDHYRELVHQLRERLAREDPDAQYRRIVRREIDQRIRRHLAPLVLIAALGWAYPTWGLPGVVVALALAALALTWEVLHVDSDPGVNRHLSVVHAEDLLRLTVIADCHAAGERVWTLGDRHVPAVKPSVVATGGPRWDGSWKRIHDWALELEAQSPRARRKRLIAAAERAKAALEQGEALAEAKGGELDVWARECLQQLRAPTKGSRLSKLADLF